VERTKCELTTAFEKALQYTLIIHAGQKRKGTDIPYFAHLLSCAALALDNGANEVEAIAALLHDAGEDAGGEGRIRDIRSRFGNDVADIVDGCTDAYVIPKPPWRQRKEAYIVHLPKASKSVRLVSAVDKLHNARAILSDYRKIGEELWSRFKGGKEGTLWYYRSLVGAFNEACENDLEAKDCKVADMKALVDELDRVVSEIEKQVEVRKMKTVNWTGAKGKPFVPTRKADDSELSLPKSERIERFNARFRSLLDGTTSTNPSHINPSLIGSDNEPEKKE
jgi:(p)ppGpp synthase/HD superfamily hydrolase